MRALSVDRIAAPPAGEAGSPRCDRTQARAEAACAIQLAARSLSLDPAALSASAYRTFCADQAQLDLPSSLAISVLFVGWQRAREQVSALTHDDVAVEARVVQELYGDPSGRHRDHATIKQPAGSIAGEPGEARPAPARYQRQPTVIAHV